jgi:nucleotide-binding universal stress UspA family protein
MSRAKLKVVEEARQMSRTLKHILIAVDDRPASDAAVALGLDLAAAAGAPVTFVHVASALRRIPDRAEVPELRSALALAEAVRVDAKSELLVGLVPEQIAALAEELDSGVIVVGSRHITGTKRLLHESTSRALLDATCRPIMVVAEPARELARSVVEDPEPSFLLDERDPILTAAVAALRRSHVRHYEVEPDAEVRRRLGRFYDKVSVAFRSRELSGVIDLARELAHERYAAGFDLSEVQTAFNVLEEAIWLRAFAQLGPEAFAPVITRTSTILGAAKDSLAREYVLLATENHAPTLNVPALFGASL